MAVSRLASRLVACATAMTSFAAWTSGVNPFGRPRDQSCSSRHRKPHLHYVCRRREPYRHREGTQCRGNPWAPGRCLAGYDNPRPCGARRRRSPQRALHRTPRMEPDGLCPGPETGRRVPRSKSELHLIARDVPEFRIVDQELWDQVQARLTEVRAASGDHQTGRAIGSTAGHNTCSAVSSSAAAVTGR